MTFEVMAVPRLSAVTMTDQGMLTEIKGQAFVASPLPLSLAQHMANSATRAIRKAYPEITVQIEANKERPSNAVGSGSGSGVLLYTRTSTGCVLGSLVLAEEGCRELIGYNCANKLIEDLKSGACVDQYTQDQVIFLMGLATGKSSVRCGPLTKFSKSAIFHAEMLSKGQHSLRMTLGLCAILKKPVNIRKKDVHER